MSSVALRIVTLTSIGLTLYGCNWSEFKAERNHNVEAEHASALVKGYEAFETMMLDTDTGLLWFAYRLPSTLVPEQVATMLADQIRVHDSCFKVEEVSAQGARLRCSSVPPAHSFREYRIAVQAGRRRVLVMYAPIDEEAEQIGYWAAVEDFKKRMASGEN